MDTVTRHATILTRTPQTLFNFLSVTILTGGYVARPRTLLSLLFLPCSVAMFSRICTPLENENLMKLHLSIANRDHEVLHYHLFTATRQRNDMLIRPAEYRY